MEKNKRKHKDGEPEWIILIPLIMLVLGIVTGSQLQQHEDKNQLPTYLCQEPITIQTPTGKVIVQSNITIQPTNKSY